MNAVDSAAQDVAQALATLGRALLAEAAEQNGTATPLLTYEQACQVLQCSDDHIRLLADAGELVCLTVGGRKAKRVTAASVEDFIRRRILEDLHGARLRE